jgi:hypothetical protein
MKVVEFFKPYNIALRFKFKKPKLVALHVKFGTKVIFELLLSLLRYISCSFGHICKFSWDVMMTCILTFWPLSKL